MINPFRDGSVDEKFHKIICSILYYHYRRNISLRFSCMVEAFASELLENLGQIFPPYYIHNDVFSMLKIIPYVSVLSSTKGLNSYIYICIFSSSVSVYVYLICSMSPYTTHLKFLRIKFSH